MTDTTASSVEELAAAAGRVQEAVEGVVVGQSAAARTLLCAYMAGGHALIEGVPGVAKTLLARTLAAALGLRFSRIQFTPDLMPGDVVGTNVFESGTGAFRLVRGPIFAEAVMADEINRTPPRTQSALLEAMQEVQVTIDGVSHPLGPVFFVIATQNPVEFEGTYPLPEAQLDRFLLRVEMGVPPREAEIELFRRGAAGALPGPGDAPPPAVVTHAEARQLRQAARRVHAAPELLVYLADLAAAVRRSPHVELPVSPRGALALLDAARAASLLSGRDFVTPDDFKSLLPACWGHRLLLTAESELEGRAASRLLEEIAAAVPVPH